MTDHKTYPAVQSPSEQLARMILNKRAEIIGHNQRSLHFTTLEHSTLQRLAGETLEREGVKLPSPWKIAPYAPATGGTKTIECPLDDERVG